MNHLKNRLALFVLVPTLALGLTACGSKDEAKPATQVAVKVDSEEISVFQINQVMSRVNTANMSPEATKTVSSDALEKLIDQQLALNQATETKLHRSPDVVAQLESSRREILARAYLQKIVGGLPKPSPEEVKKYFADNPQLFSQRRVYNIQEIVIPASADVAKDLQGFAASGKPVEEVASWLTAKDIKFGGGAATRTAEQIPLELLAKLYTLKDGQSLVVQSPQNLTFVRIASSKEAPVTEAAALPSIEQFLTNQRANDAVTANMKTLRSNAKITYMGEFAKDASAGTPVATAPVAAASADAKAQSAIDKGVAGLK